MQSISLVEIKKTNLSEETKDILKELFAQGMDSKGIKSSVLHNKAVERTGLPLQVIKDWIGNYKKVVEGRKYEAQPQTLYLKGMTGYNCFVREKKGTKEVPKDLKILQQEAQTHMNKLYSKAVGKKQAFLYTNVKKGKIQVNGIPLDVLPLVPMSDYGEKKMKMILNIKEISVEVPTSPAYEVSSLPVNNAIETELNVKVQKAVEEDNLIESTADILQA
ncbi:uncharacterized protein LOC143047161 isoform X1 [Mytilus galloprovincialis]|uniref:uncharacterized protein LOC143047161 isoform X1 n=1 Tax=Mytilus galloprovincialis TaxID=29158 RepID=UPI003F7BB370